MRPLRPAEYPPDRCVTGPHTVLDKNGEFVLGFRCGKCGHVSTDPDLRLGCWACDGRVLWR